MTINDVSNVKVFDRALDLSHHDVRYLVSEIARLQSELDAARMEIERLQDALRWCSGSADFNEGGRAYAGWQKVCAPLLEPQCEDAP